MEFSSKQHSLQASILEQDLVKTIFTSEKTTKDIYILIIALKCHPVVPTSTTGIVGKIWNALSCRLLPCWDVVSQARPNQPQRGLLSVTHIGKEGLVTLGRFLCATSRLLCTQSDCRSNITLGK